MKFKLTPKAMELLINNTELFGNATKSIQVRQLVKLGLFRDTGDKTPYFTRTSKGYRVVPLLTELLKMNIIEIGDL